MTDEPAPPRPARGAALKEVQSEDLEIYAKSDLEARIQDLQAEIARTRAALVKKDSGRLAAEAMFRMSSGGET
jgi:uncharacterized small protein (DUF1192 family)